MSSVKRPYTAPLRDASARATRRAVVEAAAALFVEQGWASTTVAQIATRAGVSRPTVFTVGSKADLLRIARDVAMAGDDEPVPVADRESFQRVLAAPDPDRRADELARHVTALLGRYSLLDGVLHEAAGADASLRELWRTSEQQRRAGARRALEGLDLPDRERAVDTVWVLMASEPHRRLVHERGWSPSAYAGWLSGQLRAALRGAGPAMR